MILLSKIAVVVTTYALLLLVGSSSTTSTFVEASKSSLSGDRSFRVVATPEQEASTPSTTTTAKIFVTFDPGYTKMNYKLFVFDGVGITQAHLHCALAGVNGPNAAFVFPLDATGVDVNGSLITGTLTNDDIITVTCPSGFEINNIASLFQAMSSNEIYLNVHSLESPGGIVRGQFFKH